MGDGHITLYIATSVDGFVADADGGVDWLEEFDAGDSYESFVAGVDALVMGSTTYEQVRDFGEWPYGDRPTYVLTSRELPRATESVELFDGAVAALAESLVVDHVWLVVGAAVAQSFLRAGLVDELHLTLAPVLLGSGIALFGDGGTPGRLTHRETTIHGSGLVELRYDIDG